MAPPWLTPKQPRTWKDNVFLGYCLLMIAIAMGLLAWSVTSDSPWISVAILVFCGYSFIEGRFTRRRRSR